MCPFVGDVEKVARQDQVLKRHMIDGYSILVEMRWGVEVGAGVLAEQHHLVVQGAASVARTPSVVEVVDGPECGDLSGVTGHPGVELVPEVNDLVEVH
jgi:hypothetical protein